MGEPIKDSVYDSPGSRRDGKAMDEAAVSSEEGMIAGGGVALKVELGLCPRAPLLRLRWVVCSVQLERWTFTLETVVMGG